ncbi:MAG: aminoacyltransferase [Dehalobacter sp. 4CP]|uniref:lipid II:glycine glycyltransferase FemX n=1 Tax=Dehalobacter sp. CP TaxID=2594474 RepID=UPI0013C8C3A1|nr:aminoacyltransferase [Dehalobacter sp.]NBJ15847.1 aminoacyltransferase [Dehalobacter sp. 4CP]
MEFTARWLTIEDKAKFNSFICKHPKGHAMQLWEWGDIKGRTGWKPWRLAVEKDGEIFAAATILERKLPLLGTPIFYCPRGPVVAMHDSEKMAAVLEAIRKLAQKRKAILLKIDPDVSSTDQVLAGILKAQGFKKMDTGKNFEGVQPKFVFRLDISPDEETLLTNMHQKTRYNIRLSSKKGVVIRKGSREDLPEFFRVLKETTERDNFLVRSYTYFEDLYDTLVPAGFAELFVAEYEGKIVAGTLAFITGDKAWYIYGASSNSYRNVMPNYLIQWEMICWAKANGCTLYDFRGVSGDLAESNPLYGLYKFKKGFNGEFTEFIGEWDYVYRPVLYVIWQIAEKAYSGKLKGLLARMRRPRHK